jgi:dTDP-4-amino-4,6-dideoxygalactose transaminase
MGYMYRTSDLAAAFARAQLAKLDKTNAQAQENWHRLHDGLKGLPYLVRPFTSRQRPTNGYAYVIRPEPAYAQKRGVTLGELTDAVSAAIAAEGASAKRARWVLPAHTVFQVKNAFGKGYPWSISDAGRAVSYDLSQYPVAQRCSESCLWVGVNTHRPPNGSRQVDAVIAAIRKVFENLDQVPIPAPKAPAAAPPVVEPPRPARKTRAAGTRRQAAKSAAKPGYRS